jgi:hypothetical protein
MKAETVPSGALVTSMSGCVAPPPVGTAIAASRSRRTTSGTRAGSETRTETRRSAGLAFRPV